MTALVWLGVAMAAAGVGLLALVIVRARRLRDAVDAEGAQTALHGLVALNFAAIALAGLGLGVVLVGLLIAPFA